MALSEAIADISRGAVVEDAAPHTRAISRIVAALLQACVGLVLIVWLIRSDVLHWPTMSRMFSARGPAGLAMLFVMANYVFLSLRLRTLIRASGGLLDWPSAMRATLIAAFAGWLIPGGLGSDVTKAYVLGRAMDGDLAHGAGVAFIDRLFGLAALIALAVAGQLAAFEMVWRVQTLRTLFLICVTILVGFAGFCVWGAWWSARVGGHEQGMPGGIHGAFRRAIGAVAVVGRRPGLAAVGFFWSLCAQASVVAAAIVVCLALTGATPNSATCAFVPVGLVANALPVSPGGLGVGEAVFEMLFQLAGTAGGAEIALTWRALAVVGSLPGLWFMIRLVRRQRAAAFARAARETAASPMAREWKID